MSSCYVIADAPYRYYLTSTTWTDIRITTASTIEGLKTAESRVIWSDVSNPDRACNFWAPEIHKVGDRWHVYFTASKCDSDWGVVLPTLKVYVLEGGADNPLSSDYRILDSIVPPNYDGGMLDAVCFNTFLLKTFPLNETCRHFSTSKIRDICLCVFLPSPSGFTQCANKSISFLQLRDLEALTEHRSGLLSSYHLSHAEMRP